MNFKLIYIDANDGQNIHDKKWKQYFSQPQCFHA